MIIYYKKKIHEKKLKKIKKFGVGSWINVIDPTEEEINYLANTFKLNKENLKSGIDEYEIPRMEFFEKNCYIILKTSSKIKENKLQTFLIILTDTFILTLSKENLFFEKETGKISTTQRLKFLLKIFESINDNFEKITSQIIRKVNFNKKNITKLSDKEINDLLELEDFLNEFLVYFSYVSVCYSKAIKNLNFYKEDKELIDDIIIDTEQKLNLCRLTLKNISNLRNKIMILSSNKLNRLITILTLFTVFISIPAAISGLYGMNVTLPLSSNQNIFYYILGFVLIIWGAFIIYLRKINSLL